MTYGMQQMGLAQASSAVQEQWIVGSAGRPGNRQRGGGGEVVAVPDDKGVEGVPRIQTQPAGDRISLR